MIYKDNNISLIRANVNSMTFDSGTISFDSSYPFSNLFYPFLLDNGGTYSTISLTIDVLSKEFPENKFPNEKWVNESRLRNNLLYDNIKWGFKETNNIAKDSRAISNAFCFSGQKLSFYIATKGHDTGYVNDTWCYCKTTIVVTVLDLMTGTQTQLSSFSNFSSEDTEIARYFQWTVPNINYDIFNSYGLFGMFVIKLDVTRELFKDAERTQILETSCPNKSQALLQLLTYSIPHEFMTVSANNIDIITSPITWHSSPLDIFNNSVFASLQTLNDNDLTDDQKRSIITDQAAVLFMSQHPVVVADCYPSKIIGFGAEEAIRPKYIFDSFLSNKTIKTLETLSVDRLYGMIATYQAFNYIEDIQSNFSNFNQSQQKLRDPARSVIVNPDSILDDGYGISGIQFNPYIVELNNAEVIDGSQKSFEFSITLTDNDIEINNIQVREDNDNPFTIDNFDYYLGSGQIKVSFDVSSGEDKINRIRYVIWSKNNLENYEHIDYTGLTREYVFTVRRLGNSPLGVSYSSSLADTVYIRIDIEDVDGNVKSFDYEKLLPEPVFDSITKPGISSILVSQRQDGSELVDINYNYFGLSTINASKISASMSLDGITYTDLNSTSIRGDVGISIYPGNNRIIWKPSLSLASTTVYPITVYIKLTLLDADNNANIGISSAIGIVNLNKPDVVIRRLSIEEEYPEGTTLDYRIALMDELSNTSYYYLLNGFVSESIDFTDIVTSDYRVAFLDENDNTRYHYLVNGLVSLTKDYLTPVNNNYKIGIMDEYTNTYYYYINKGRVVSKVRE